MALTLLFPPSLGRIKASARAELLAGSLSRRLGQTVHVDVADSYGDLERRVRADDVALAWAPPSICARAQPTARAILKAVRRGRSRYCAALVSRVEQRLTVETLAGSRAAWVDPLSAGGYLLALGFLKRAGIDPDTTFAAQRFLGSYRDALLAVLAGDADLTSIYSHGKTEEEARIVLSEHVGAAEVQLHPLAFTSETPSDGLIIGSQLSLTDADRLIENLAGVVDGSRGPTLLLELFDADTLVLASDHDYDVLNDALAQQVIR